MKIKKLFILITLTLFFEPKISNAQIGGNYTYSFLEISTAPQINALGGKDYISKLTQFVSYYNPSALDSIFVNQASFGYRNYLAGIKQGQFSYTFKFFDLGYIALGINYFDYGKIDKYDEFGYYFGKTTASDLVTYLTYSFYIDSQIRLGANIKWIESKLDIYRSFGFAYDLGIYIQPTDYFSLSLVLRNKGKQLKTYTNNTEPLPYNVAFGTAIDLPNSPFGFSFNFDFLNYWKMRYISPIEMEILPHYIDTISTVGKVGKFTDELIRHLHFGTKVKFSNHFLLLIGYNFRRAKELSIPYRRTSNGLSFGMYLTTSKINLSYSLEYYHLFTVNTFGFTVNLGNFYKKIKVAARSKDGK